MSSKNLLRKEMKQRISALSSEVKDNKSLVINSHLVELITNLQKSTVLVSPFILGLYAPMKDEVSFKFLDLLGATSATSAFPFSDQGVMGFRKCTFEELEETAIFGVPLMTPPENAEKITPDLLLIPGLAFDKSGGRLGRGKGFYDRFLAEFKGLKVGICFEEQLINTVPREDHDVNVDFVVSERGTNRTA
ncbi:MAG: 5-formyltetrahydrofolate cyclo-ligase [Halobacteriovoraceae bacterium]|nr:5-formyltetrahydrofolate cyclo-ligase [Halobacteriovoraceae bacterium]